MIPPAQQNSPPPSPQIYNPRNQNKNFWPSQAKTFLKFLTPPPPKLDGGTCSGWLLLVVCWLNDESLISFDLSTCLFPANVTWQDDILYNNYHIWWVFVARLDQALSLDFSIIYYCCFYNEYYLHPAVLNCYMFWCCAVKALFRFFQLPLCTKDFLASCIALRSAEIISENGISSKAGNLLLSTLGIFGFFPNTIW